MSVCVIPRTCVFDSLGVFLNVEGCVQVHLKSCICGLSQMRTHGKDFLGPIKGVHMWFESNAYSWKACVDLFCGGQGRDIVSFE